MCLGLLLLLLFTPLCKTALILPQEIDVQMTLMPKLANINVENASAVVVTGDFHCKSSQLDSISQVTHAVLIIIGNIQCFPSQLGEMVINFGFAGVLYVDDTSYYDMNVINYWNRNGNGAPVYRTRQDDIDWSSVQRIWLQDSFVDNFFQSDEFLREILIVSIALALLSLWKLLKALNILKSYRKSKTWLLHGIVVLVVESAASIVVIIYCIDFQGLRGFFPWGVTMMLTRLYAIFAQITTFVIWDGIVIAQYSAGIRENATESHGVHKSVKVLVISLLALELFVIVHHFIRGIYPLVAVIEFTLAVFQSIFFSFAFIKNKSDVLNLLKQTTSRNQREQAKRSANFLFLSALFMILGILILIATAYTIVYVVPSYFGWYCIASFALSQIMVGITQIYSVPYYRRPQREIVQLIKSKL